MRLTLEEINACPILKAVHQQPGINTMILIRRGLIPSQAKHQLLKGYLTEGRVYTKHGGFYVAVVKPPRSWKSPAKPQKVARRSVRFKYNATSSNPFVASIQAQAEARCEVAIQQLVNLGKPFDYEAVEGIALVPAGFVKRTRRIEVMADRANRQIRQNAREVAP